MNIVLGPGEVDDLRCLKWRSKASYGFCQQAAAENQEAIPTQKAPQPETSNNPSNMPRIGEKEKAPSGASKARASAHDSGTRRAKASMVQRMVVVTGHEFGGQDGGGGGGETRRSFKGGGIFRWAICDR